MKVLKLGLLTLVFTGMLAKGFAGTIQEDITYLVASSGTELVTSTSSATANQYSDTITITSDTIVTLGAWNIDPQNSSNQVMEIDSIELAVNFLITKDTNATLDLWLQCRETGNPQWYSVGSYVITSSNDVTLWSSASTSDETVDIADGVYTGASLATALQVAIRANSDIGLTSATVTYSDWKFIIDGSYADTTTTSSLTYSGSDMAPTIGFRGDSGELEKVISHHITPGKAYAFTGDGNAELAGFIPINFLMSSLGAYLSDKLDSLPIQIRIRATATEDLGTVQVRGDSTITTRYHLKERF